MTVFFVFAFTALYMVIVYPLARIGVWITAADWKLWWGLALLLLLSIVLVRVLENSIWSNTTGGGLRAVYNVMGWFWVAFPLVFLVDISRSLYLYFSDVGSVSLAQTDSRFGVFAFLLVTLVWLYGVWQCSRAPAVNHIEIVSEKVSREYVFLHISDLQLGSMSGEYTTVVRKIMDDLMQEHEVDGILHTGDVVDSELYTREDLAKLDFGDLPHYFSLGNHEFYHDTERLLPLLESLNYTLLREDHLVFEEINVIGIDDAESRERVASQLDASPNLLSQEKFNVLLYHRPTGVDDAEARGVDLMLSGHTHGGQLIPYAWWVRSLYKYDQGTTQVGNMLLHVTDGLGLWGPRVRLGTRNELALIRIVPKS